MTAASCDDNPLDGSSAHQTWLPFSAVHAMFQLEESFAAFGVNVVADRRAAEFDGLMQHVMQSFV